MLRAVRAPFVLALVLAALLSPGRAPAAEPPNQNDPCSRGGKNTCGTNGIGFYDTYRYGIRWFGDFKGAIPGQLRGFCIDLRFWYPSPAYKYAEDTSPTLVNKDREVVPLANRRRMAYALWTYGRSSLPTQQAAVMLYVHGLMGDAAPGEADPRGVNAAVTAVYARIAAASERFHGPYTVDVDLPARLKLGERGTGTIRVRAEGGAAVPDVKLVLSATGASGLPRTVDTGADGVARIAFTATDADGVELTVRTEPIASTLPKIYRPTTPAAAPNGQRLAVPSSQVVTGTGSVDVSRNRVQVETVATPATLLVGATSIDRIVVGNVADSYRVTVAARLFGPFRTSAAIRCGGTPVWQGSVRVTGKGTYATPAVTIERPGWYVYQHVFPSDDGHVGLTTPCGDPKERFKAEVQPKVRTVVSEQRVSAGSSVFDRVFVEGLAGEKVTVKAELFGPYPSKDAMTCTGAPAWSSTLEFAEDGEQQTAPATLTVPGYYTYRETIDASELVRAVQTRCGEASETTIVTATPTVRTRVSAQRIAPGALVLDRVTVSGAGTLTIPITVRLYGPFPTRDAIVCEGRPRWSGTVTAKGDGTYTTTPVRIDRVGYYTYRESIAEGAAWAAFEGRCGILAETTVARARPTVTTLASSEVVLPGSTVFDRVSVRGLGRSPAVVTVELFGPFSTRDAIRCTGTPVWKGELTVRGDGTYRAQATRVTKAGLYVFREKLSGTDLVEGTVGECGLVPETTLARPLVLTGRNERARAVRVAARGPLDPIEVQLEARGITAPVSAVGIDLARGALAVPAPIGRTGWWRDGQTPGSRTGAVLIAGHVDSARLGAGAFYRLREARPGDRIRVTTRNGRVFTYRVVSNRTMVKEKLPPNVYERAGRPRLVLVTCGGPFVPAEGRYRDNIVVTAVPV